jgi:hypothetical protein
MLPESFSTPHFTFSRTGQTWTRTRIARGIPQKNTEAKFRSFLEAYVSTFRRPPTFADLAHLVQSGEFTIEDCMNDRDVGTLKVLRATLIRELISLKRRERKPTAAIIASIKNARALLQSVKNDQARNCLSEAIHHLEDLHDTAPAFWSTVRLD